MSFEDIKRAIMKDKLKEVKKLVAEDPSIVNVKNATGDTPLFVAVHEQHLDIIQFLIDNKANVNNKNTKDGWTALHIACYLKDADIVKLLIQNSANVKAKTLTGSTPLQSICESGSHNLISLEIINMLLDEIMDETEDTPKEDKYINKKTNSGTFPLYVACERGDEDMVNLLLGRGADIEEEIEDGTTTLMIAVKENQDKSHLEVIKILLKNGADGEVAVDMTDNNDHSALFYAQENGDTEVIAMLMQFVSDSSSPTPSPTPISSSTPSYTPSSTPISSSRSSSSKGVVSSVTTLGVAKMKKSKLPKTAEDFINLEDVKIKDFLAENEKNKIIKLHNTLYALNGEDVKSHYLSKKEMKHHVFYPCKRALPPPALGVTKNDVDIDRPLFSASYLVGVLSDFVLLSEVNAMLASDHKYFEIDASDYEEIPASASAQMFTSRANAVSANHCQEGKASKIIKLKMLKLVKTKTRKNKGKTIKRGKTFRKDKKK